MIEEKEIIEFFEEDCGFNKKDIDTLLSIIKYFNSRNWFDSRGWEAIDYLVAGFNAGKESIKENKGV